MNPQQAHGELDVSVVLPVYNERAHLEKEIDRIRTALDASPYSYEIIVVDDGSTDGSAQSLEGMRDIRLIRFETNRGSGSARRAGTRAAKGRMVVWTDVDMTYPNDEIPRLIKEMDGYDQVVGARTSEQGTAKALRVPAKWFIRKLACYLSGTHIPDLNSGLRVFRKNVALRFLHLLPPGFSCVTTMTMCFLNNGYTVKYIPIDYFPRAGESKFHWWSDTRRYLLQVLRMMLLYNPLKVFMPLGFGTLAIASGKLGYDILDKGARVASNTLLLFIAGFMTVVVGLLSDLIVQLHKPSEVPGDAAHLPPGQSPADSAETRQDLIAT